MSGPACKGRCGKQGFYKTGYCPTCSIQKCIRCGNEFRFSFVGKSICGRCSRRKNVVELKNEATQHTSGGSENG